LTALRQVGFLVEVVRLEQGRGAFAGVGREDRRIHEDEPALIEEVAAGSDDLMPDPQDGVLAV
jgi:hypothetical protein